MNVDIRKATADDLRAMLAWRGHAPAMREAITREFERMTTGDRIIFLAFAGDALVGTVQLVRTHEDPDLIRDAVYLQALEVHSEQRGRGLGRRLTRTLEDQARLEGSKRVTLMVEPENHAALALYRKLGYTRFKDSDFTWDGEVYAVLCLEKHLQENP